MNPLYEQIFNQQYVNPAYLQQIYYQQYHSEQQMEIAKAVKALHDYFDAARKIAPEYQQQAFVPVQQRFWKRWVDDYFTDSLIHAK